MSIGTAMADGGAGAVEGAGGSGAAGAPSERGTHVAGGTLPLLELRGVSLAYRRGRREPLAIVSDMTLGVTPGELVCVAGRSGSGKTSLLSMAAGFLAPDVGEVRWRNVFIDAREADGTARGRRGFLGFVFQEAALIPTLTAAENVAIVRDADGRIALGPGGGGPLLERVGLGDRADHFPSQLSGGEQQRVAIARALVGDPPLLIVDEPTAHLDRAAADHVITLLADLCAEGRGVLVASHDHAMIERAGRVIRMD